MINWLQYVIHWSWTIFEITWIVTLFIAVSTIQIIFHKYTGLKKCLKTGKDTQFMTEHWTQNTAGVNEKFGKWIIFIFLTLWHSFWLAFESLMRSPLNEWKHDVENTNKNSSFFLYLFLLQNFLPLINSPPKKKTEEIKKTFTAYTKFSYIRSYRWPFFVFVFTCFTQWNNGDFFLKKKTIKWRLVPLLL